MRIREQAYNWGYCSKSLGLSLLPTHAYLNQETKNTPQKVARDYRQNVQH
jgi:hypothetical protein